MSDPLILTLLSFANWIHLAATVAWIGAITSNILILLPAAKIALEPPAMGRLLGVVMKRFRFLVYTSIASLALTGVVMNILNKNYLGLLRLDNLWSQLMFSKHALTVLLIIIAVYAFEVLAPKVTSLAAKGLSPKLARLQKLQVKLAFIGFIFGLAILLLTAIATAISSRA